MSDNDEPKKDGVPAVDDPTDTPFSRLGLDPWQTPEEITEAMREMAEDADPEERRRLQGQWRELTLKQGDRLDLVLFSHPHPGRRLPPLDLPPDELVARYAPGGEVEALPSSLASWRPSVEDLVLLPPVRLKLGRDDGDWPDVPPREDILLRL